LPRAERALSKNLGLAAIVGLVLVFGAITELRSAFLIHRHTDAGIYFRAAWAAQAGQSLYEVTDDNGWHYHYPPLLAVLLRPLADPPAGVAGGRLLPYPISVALWYALGVVALVWAVHGMARAIEASSRFAALRRPAFSRPWWTLRLVPAAVSLAAIGETLGRGQVSTILLLCVTGMVGSFSARRGGRAGLWLAGAICLKVFPAYLLIYPAWRRDWRCLAACALGLVLGLAIIPAAALGPGRTIAAYDDFYRLVLRGATANTPDASTVEEFYHEREGDVMSFRSVLFKTLHPDPATRPPALAAWYDWTQKLLGLGSTLLVLFALGRPEVRSTRAIEGPDSVVTTVIVLGLLLLGVIPLVPVSQPHYYALVLPLVMGMIADDWQRRGRPRLSSGLGACLALYTLANLLAYLPGLERLMDLGLPMYAGLALWVAGLVVLWRRRAMPSQVPHAGEDLD
jgi:hypothetical protein